MSVLNGVKGFLRKFTFEDIFVASFVAVFFSSLTFFILSFSLLASGTLDLIIEEEGWGFVETVIYPAFWLIVILSGIDAFVRSLGKSLEEHENEMNEVV